MTVDAKRRRMLGASSGVLVLVALGAGISARGAEKVIRVTARKFVFTPNEIALRKGEPVVIELATQDVFMGFNVPELKVRSDIVPGKVMRLSLTPDRAGTFVFLCDVFCGDGHETMSGKIVVT
jgi:cytochrome c oxidase subunit 2